MDFTQIMTLKFISAPLNGLQSVLFPALAKSVGAVLLFSGLPSFVHADMPAHGRPGNLKPLPGVAIGAGASAGNSNTQQYAYLEGKFNHKLMVVADFKTGQSEESDVAINGSLDVEADGTGFGIYYQLPESRNMYLTAAIRQLTNNVTDSEIILSGSSQVGYLEKRVPTEITLLAEHSSWARGGWQPYVGLGYRQTKITTDISTTGGRQISQSKSVQNSGQFTGGLHYQYKKLSWFLEATASTAKDSPFQIHTGLRLGFFHRPAGGK